MLDIIFEIRCNCDGGGWELWVGRNWRSVIIRCAGEGIDRELMGADTITRHPLLYFELRPPHILIGWLYYCKNYKAFKAKNIRKGILSERELLANHILISCLPSEQAINMIFPCMKIAYW